MRRTLAITAVMLAVAGCTPREIAMWADWHRVDPDAAITFAEQLEPDDEPATAPRSVWDVVARCESGGRWDYPPVTNRTGTYSGGLMIWTKAWDAYGGDEFADQAWLASKAEQIVVAERILADRGWRAWDCAP